MSIRNGIDRNSERSKQKPETTSRLADMMLSTGGGAGGVAVSRIDSEIMKPQTKKEWVRSREG